MSHVLIFVRPVRRRSMLAQIVIVGVVAVFFLVRLTIALRGRS